jgi:hypothetical protein
MPRGRIRFDLTGHRFGRLVAVNYAGDRKWTCSCDCGSTSTVAAADLRSGHTSSCGCLVRMVTGANFRKHGNSFRREYQAWKAMLGRCLNPSHPSYKNYGARGIGCDPAWSTFEAFIADMGDCPEGLTLERKDNNKGYSKSNCKWASRHEQAQNLRKSKRYEFNGESLILPEWSRRLGISKWCLRSRVEAGWRDIILAKPRQREVRYA